MYCGECGERKRVFLPNAKTNISKMILRKHCEKVFFCSSTCQQRHDSFISDHPPQPLASRRIEAILLLLGEMIADVIPIVDLSRIVAIYCLEQKVFLCRGTSTKT